MTTGARMAQTPREGPTASGAAATITAGATLEPAS